MSDAAYTFLLVCEGPSDVRTVKSLTERVLAERVVWLQGQDLSAFIRWTGLTDDKDYLKWSQVSLYAREAKIKVHGGFQELTEQRGEARKALLALRVMKHHRGELGGSKALLLFRDSDGELARRAALEAACQRSSWNVNTAIAVAHPMRESWLIAGFVPRDDEQAVLQQLRVEFGKDVTIKSHELAPRDDTAPSHPKNVLVRLIGNDPMSEERCCLDAPLNELIERGQENGLAEFIAALEDAIVPLFGG